jgi:hypothetical protein
MKITATVNKKAALRIKDMEIGKVYVLAITENDGKDKQRFLIRLNEDDVIMLHNLVDNYTHSCGYVLKGWKLDNSEVHEFNGSFTISN